VTDEAGLRRKLFVIITDLLGRVRNDHRSAVVYTASTLTKTVVQFISSMVIVRLIAPKDLGLWGSVSLATTYATLFQAGINNGLNRELPHYLGKGDDETANRLAGTAQTFTLGACVSAFAVGLGALVWFRDRGPAISLVICAEIVMVLYTLYQSYLTVTFRSKSSFLDLAKTEFLNAPLGLILLPVVFFFGFEGMLIRVVVLSLAAVAFLHAVRPMRVKLTWNWPALSELLKTGFPIFVLSYVESTSGTFDRVFLLQRAGVEQVGYYSLGMMTQQAMMVIPASVAIYVYPRMTYALAKEDDLLALWERAWKSTAAVFAIMLPLAICAVVALGWLVPTLFPKYVPGIPAAQILVFASLFSGALIGVNALWSMKAWTHMVTYQLSAGGMRALGPFIGISLHSDPLSGVAWGTLGAFLGQLVLSIILTHHATHCEGVALKNAAAVPS
jgi:O-antigen/teichoic acid export membrane protein